VITGAASGIGEALAVQLAQQGAQLMLADIDATGLERVALAVGAFGKACHTLVVDTGVEADIFKLASYAEARMGSADVIINNAGVALVSPIDKLQTSDANWLMNINFWGVVHGCRAFLPQLKNRPQAMIVNVSSIFAMVSMPTQGMYNAAKAGVRAFSDSLREELRGTSVGVLCVHPGGIKTNIANKARVIDTEMLQVSADGMRHQFNSVARTTPEQAARTIIAAMQTQKTRVLIGADARILDWMYRISPHKSSNWFSRISRRMTPKEKV